MAMTIAGILICLAFFTLFLSIPVAAEGGAAFAGTPIDYGTDSDGDGNFNTLTVELEIESTVPGIYKVYGSMWPSSIPENVNIKNYFEKGINTVYLNFDGKIIYEKTFDGPYIIDIELYNKDQIANLTYYSDSYSYKDFNPSPPSEPEIGTSLEVYNNTIILKNSVFVAVIYEQKPEITFYYSIDEGQSAKFKVTYPRIIGFDDINNNGEYDGPGELVCEADFYQVIWTSTKTLMESYESFNFEVSATMDLMDVNNNQLSWITVSFHYSSLTELPKDLEAARKFDINLELYEPIENVDYFAIEHQLYDETNTHNFKLVQTAFGPKISLEDQSGSEHGYYLWKSTASAGNGDEFNEVEVGYSLKIDNTEMTLYLNYPYDTEYRQIIHDPAIGVNPENQPELPATSEDPIIQHQVLLYIIVFCVGGAIIIGSIYWQRKQRE